MKELPKFILIFCLLLQASISTAQMSKSSDRSITDTLRRVSNLNDTSAKAYTSTTINGLGVDSIPVKNDSLTKTISKKIKKKHSPALAAIFSAVLPGLGQGYNKKYWKIPIVYAGLGGLGYAVYYTASNFNGYKKAYRLQVDENPNTLGSYKGIDNSAALKIRRDYYKRYLDISAVVMAVWYTLNIVDATVDAHLFEWNMSDDLSITLQPDVQLPQNTVNAGMNLGFALAFHF